MFASCPAPLWRDDGLNGQAVCDRGPVKVTFDVSPPGGESYLEKDGSAEEPSRGEPAPDVAPHPASVVRRGPLVGVDGPDSLRVMSFNVRGFTSPVDGSNRWATRAGRNVATVRDHAPDVLGVQELQREALATYRERLPEYELLLGPAAGNGRRPEYNAILFSPERLHVVDTGGFWLSETPDVPSSSWGARVVRTANWATFAVRGSDVVFRHVNTHLDHWSGRARRQSADLVMQYLGPGEGTVPTVLTGDFNCPPDSAPHRMLVTRGYQDTYRRPAEDAADDGSTFHAFGGVRSVLARRVHRLRYGRRPLRWDWILVGDGRRRWRVEACAVLRDRDPVTGAPPSDHDPVLARLRLA